MLATLALDLNDQSDVQRAHRFLTRYEKERFGESESAASPKAPRAKSAWAKKTPEEIAAIVARRNATRERNRVARAQVNPLPEPVISPAYRAYMASVHTILASAIAPMTIPQIASAAGLRHGRAKWVLYCSPEKARYRKAGSIGKLFAWELIRPTGGEDEPDTAPIAPTTTL